MQSEDSVETFPKCVTRHRRKISSRRHLMIRPWKPTTNANKIIQMYRHKDSFLALCFRNHGYCLADGIPPYVRQDDPDLDKSLLRHLSETFVNKLYVTYEASPVILCALLTARIFTMLGLPMFTVPPVISPIPDEESVPVLSIQEPVTQVFKHQTHCFALNYARSPVQLSLSLCVCTHYQFLCESWMLLLKRGPKVWWRCPIREHGGPLKLSCFKAGLSFISFMEYTTRRIFHHEVRDWTMNTLHVDNFKRMVMECKRVNFFDTSVRWSRVAKKLKLNPTHEKKNSDQRLSFKLDNMLIVKQLFSFGLWTVPRGEGHVFQTSDSTMLIFHLPSKCLQCHPKPSTVRKSFVEQDQFLYDRYVMHPNSIYVVPPQTRYLILTVQKTLFAVDTNLGKMQTRLLQKESVKTTNR
ncbi:hypothetical protein HNY73_016034 [Argiope bruennichi]|uniref:Uncharacterized protein n=1 Tax=Argiope bruennichi TaxID=94029 RepID=A0A8T0EIR3_ARGBR|nr:hypothetical protein HNY73_016034 [Argiope bruennichi]